MPAPKGNQYAKGNKGGGRQPEAVEKWLQAVLRKAFFGKGSTKDLKRKIAKGRYSIWDAFVAKAKSGDVSAMKAIFNKIFPDQLKEDVRNIDGYELSLRDDILRVFNEYRESHNRGNGAGKTGNPRQPIQDNKQGSSGSSVPPKPSTKPVQPPKGTA